MKIEFGITDIKSLIDDIELVHQLRNHSISIDKCGYENCWYKKMLRKLKKAEKEFYKI